MADQEEIKIPVFSVLKNGIVMKNIFLNNPKWENSSQNQDEEDDFILIGRHPDCHIVLDHPSISRFHLEIRAKPASQKLSMIDRASVHGTWVAGEKIQPNVATDLVEGDTVKLGASTRVYKLHWVSMSRAFEMEKPFLPALTEENEDGHQLEYQNVIWTQEIPSAPPLSNPFSLPFVNDNQILAGMEFEERSPISCSAVPVSESIIGSSLVAEGENRTPEKNGNANKVQTEREYKSPLRSLSPLSRRSKSRSVSSCSAVPVSESTIGSSLLAERENGTPKKNDNANEVQIEWEYKSPLRSSLLSRRSKSKSVSSLRIHTGRTEGKIGERSSTKELDIKRERDEILCRILFAGSKEEEDEEALGSDKQNANTSSQTSHKSNHEPSLDSSAIFTMREDLFYSPKETLSHEDLISLKQNRPISATSVEKINEARALDKKHRQEELQKSSWRAITALIEEDDAFYSDKENCTPEVPSKMKSTKAIHTDYIQTNGGREEEEDDEAFFSDKENQTPIVIGSRKPKKLLPVEFSNTDGKEACFSDKENMTPIASGVKKLKKELTESQLRNERLIMERRKERIPFRSLLENSPSKIGNPLKTEQNIVNKEMTPSFMPLLEKSPLKNNSPHNDPQRVVGKERVPFRSLSESSPSRIGQRTMGKERISFQSVQSSPSGNSSSVSSVGKTEDTGNKYSSFIPPTQKIEEELRSNSSIHAVDHVSDKVEGNKKKWNMIVDTDCFLNHESKKSLQLLEGLKGTQLIIPSIVIRELDCLKRRESLFRKETKVASSVLQWIEECMVKSSWWIHVQSSLETMPSALTPPSTPRTEFCDKSLMEIVSPTAEDHILNCALMFKRIKDEQFVLLTDSVTLKIKAMAEGLLCETAIEFRESLVHPYSKRFLWSASSPRGSTWSCLDEVGLIENHYYQFPAIRKTAKVTESIRGLQLVLLHNSHYGQTSSFS